MIYSHVESSTRRTVGADGRYFADEAGKPFFWLADTAWAMPLRLERDEIVDYLDARKAQGFTVVQTVAIFNQAGTVVTEDKAADYGIFLGARYADDQVVWVMGGDAAADGVEDVWRELARGIVIGATDREDYSTTLMTYHPVGDHSSAEWFQDDRWLDFNVVQGGHCLRYGVRRDIIDQTYAASPPKPMLDGEPIYSAHPYCWKPADGYSTPMRSARSDGVLGQHRQPGGSILHICL